MTTNDEPPAVTPDTPCPQCGRPVGELRAPMPICCWAAITWPGYEPVDDDAPVGGDGAAE